MPPKSTRKPSARPASPASSSTSLSSAADQSIAPAGQTQQTSTQHQQNSVPQTPGTTRVTRSRTALTGGIRVNVSDYPRSERPPRHVQPRGGDRGGSRLSEVASAQNQTSSVAGDTADDGNVGAGAGTGPSAATDSNAMAGPSTVNATVAGTNPNATTGPDAPVPTIEGQDTEDDDARDTVNSRLDFGRRGFSDPDRGHSPWVRQLSPSVRLFNNTRPGPRYSRPPSIPPPPVATPPRASPVPSPPSDSVNGPPAPSPSHGTITSETSPADPDPEPDTGAENEAVDPDPRWLVFLRILWEQVVRGMSYLTRPRNWWAAGLAFFLLCLQMCSFGDICAQNRVWTVFFTLLGYTPGQYICLFIANTLTIAGIMDMAEGIAAVVNGVGIRAARKGFQVESPSWEEGSLANLLEDIHDKVLEPFLVLTMTSAFRHLVDFGDISSASQLVIVSSILHLIKWVCEAIAIYRDSKDWRFEGRRRLFMDLLLLLVPVAAVMHRKSLPSFWDGFDAATWFNNARTSEKKPMGRVHIEHLVAEIPYPARAVHEVTHKVVTKWVEPTHRV